MSNQKQPKTFARVLTNLLIIGGLVGLAASSALTIEKIELIKNPGFVPSCNLSPLVSCGSVMKTHQAEVFGFANSLIGIASFAIVTTIGVSMLAGAKFKRWFWIGLELGTIFGVLFVHWLFFQSVFRIGALCPYCMIVWSVTIPVFWYTTLYNLEMGNIATPAKLKRIVAFAQRHHADILVVWILIIIGFILNHFWYYWQTFL